MRFENTTSAQRIAAYPRAVYRITIERNPLAALSYATGVLRWSRVVQNVVDRSINPAAFALSSGSGVLDSATVATLDFQAKATAGNAETVADLVNAVASATPYARVIVVRRLPPVPGVSAGGADALAADRAADDANEQRAAAERSPLAVIGDGLRTARTVLIVAVIIAAAVAAYRLIPQNTRAG